MPTLSVTTRSSAEIAADALVVGALRGSDGPELAPGHGLPRQAEVHLQAVLAALDATGDLGEVHRVVSVPGVRATTVVVAGLSRSEAAEPDAATIRRAAQCAVKSVASKAAVAIALPAGDLARVAAAAEGAYAGCYSFVKPTRSARGRTAALTASGSRTKITVVSGAGQAKPVKDAVARAAVLGAAQDWVRDLVNAPPNLLYPQSFTEAVKSRVAASSAKVTLSILDEKALVKGGFGGIVGVGQASSRPPRMVTMTYSPQGARGSVALVGKGITFDTGGVNLKPVTAMLGMKADMAGAAAVAAAVLAAAELGLPITVRGYLCLAENMPGGHAQRPNDVVIMRNGTSVEILDTDAEGRMVLGDGLSLAAEAQPDVIVDIATLTGIQQIALGRIAAVMGNDDDFRADVLDAAATAGEDAWPMPLPEQLRSKLDSQVADLAHKGDRDGGMLTAAIFLRHFVPQGVPWAHLDIAGPAFNDTPGPYGEGRGATAYGVATLLRLLEARARA
ncbi:MAG: leucyl aminopeptidase [Tetrasphaera sp.]|nr:leucyl aminopeptidase [Tetrasphaera sp.]